MFSRVNETLSDWEIASPTKRLLNPVIVKALEFLSSLSFVSQKQKTCKLSNRYPIENVEIPNETLQRYIVIPNRKCSYPIHQKSGTDLPNALKVMGVCLF